MREIPEAVKEALKESIKSSLQDPVYVEGYESELTDTNPYLYTEEDIHTNTEINQLYAKIGKMTESEYVEFERLREVLKQSKHLRWEDGRWDKYFVEKL